MIEEPLDARELPKAPAVQSTLREARSPLPFLRKIGKAPEQLAAINFELTVPTHSD